MNFAIYETKFGNYKIEYENNYILSIKKVKDKINDYGIKNNLTDNVIKQLNNYFEGNLKKFTFKYKLVGTDFQVKVWNALCTIPYGETRSYKQIAAQVGNEKASRAVGMANNKNPISIAVPCHRVIGSNNKLVGYAGGLDVKERLLKLERDNK